MKKETKPMRWKVKWYMRDNPSIKGEGEWLDSYETAMEWVKKKDKESPEICHYAWPDDETTMQKERHVRLQAVSPLKLDEIQVLVGASGKMYIPTPEDLKDESFVLVKPYKILTEETPEQVKQWWELGCSIVFS